MWGVDIVIDFIDRVSSGKKIIKYENGTTETVTIENAEDATVEGTPINRETLMAIQGFIASEMVSNPDGSITQTNSRGEKLITFPWIYKDDVTQQIIFEGEKKITIIREFSEGKIKERFE